MSHATNLRNRQHALQAAGPSSKRRKSSPSSSSTNPKSNGITSLSNGSYAITETTLSALPSRNAKSSHSAAENPAQHIKDGVQLTNGDARNGDVDMGDASSDDSNSDSDSSSSSDDDDETSDSEAEQKDTLNSASSQKTGDDPQGQTKAHTVPKEMGEDNDSDSDSDSGSEGEAQPKNDHKSETKQKTQLDKSALQEENDDSLSNGPATGEDNGEPSFGELLRQRAPEAVDVEAEMAETTDQVYTHRLDGATRNKHLSTPTAASLGTVLTQALRTNDVELLETCLQMQNLDSIRATIERLHSPLSTTLLQRLAERLHRRPGRAGSLMVWVQWTVVAHGGYLATQPAAMKEIKTLYYVVKQRANALQPLLALKGKLDMLEAQLQLRRNMQTRDQSGDPARDAEAVVYVEGEESSDDDEEADGDVRVKGDAAMGMLDDESDADGADEEDSELEEDDDGVEDGLLEYGLEDEESDDDDDDEDMFDEEAEESENDSDQDGFEGDGNEIEFDEDDVSEDSEDDDDARIGGSTAAVTERRPQKRSKLSSAI